MNVETSDPAPTFQVLGMPGTSYLFTIDGMNQQRQWCEHPLVGALASCFWDKTKFRKRQS